MQKFAHWEKNEHHVYEMNGQILDQVRDEKDLGVIIDHELKLHKQTASAVKKANGLVY